MFSSDVIVAENSIFDIVDGGSRPMGGGEDSAKFALQTRIGPSLIKLG